MRLSHKALAWSFGVLTGLSVLLLLAFALAFLVLLEGSFGPDGLLCEWGITTGETSNGCGG